MAEEYFQLNHTGQQIDDAVNEINNLDNIIKKNNTTVMDAIYNNKIHPLEMTVQGFDDKIEANTVNKENYNRDMTGISGRITFLEQENDVRKDDINQLIKSLGAKAEKSDISTQIKALEGKDISLENQIEKLNSSVKINNNSIVENRGRLDILEKSDTSIKTQIKTINTNITGLDAKVSSLSSSLNDKISESKAEEIVKNYTDPQINNLQAQIDTLSNQITKLQEQIDKLTNSTT